MKKGLITGLCLFSICSSFASYNSNGVGSHYVCEVLTGKTITIGSNQNYMWTPVVTHHRYEINDHSMTELLFDFNGHSYAYSINTTAHVNEEAGALAVTLYKDQQAFAQSTIIPSDYDDRDENRRFLKKFVLGLDLTLKNLHFL